MSHVAEICLRERERERDKIRVMAFEAVCPLKLTIDRLVHSSRISIESPSREILESARDGVKVAIQLLYFVGRLSDSVESKAVRALEGEIKEAAIGLEYVLDSHVSEQFLSQSETESIHPLLICLDLQGVRQDIDGYTQKMKKLQKLFHPSWDEDEEEESGYEEEEEIWDEEEEVETFMAGLSDESGVTRTNLINATASEAASVFMGMKAEEEEYIQELLSLFPENEDGDKYNNLYVRFKIRCWWANKAASLIMMNSEYIKEIDNPPPEEEEEEVDDSSREDFSENMSNMVGVTDKFCEIRDNLIKGSNQFRFTSILGMAGIGKTALAVKILQDPLISSRFERSIFVRIGPEYEIQNIVRDILAQLNPELVDGGGDLDECLHKIFKDRKILIVLDDVWGQDLMSNLARRLHPDEVWGCCFLVTSRIRSADYYLVGDEPYIMRFLNNKESWDLLLEKVFAGEACPRELEKSGKKIAENCEGLPLLIITVADLLSKAEKTPEYWTEVASSKKNSIFIDAYEKLLVVLYPSYSYLPQHLKTCFLYMGAFPQNCEVRISKLINLWNAEGLGDFDSYYISKQYVKFYFEDLLLHNVALATQHSSLFDSLKACTLHSVFWYLSKREAWNEKFLHVLDSYADASVQGIEGRRRLSVYKNTIFSIKDVHHSIESISGVRSLLCTGPYHLYQVPICFSLRLLKVLDALTIRFYEFPPEVLKLVQLRYLALTCNGNLPPSISKLWALQCLIVHPHQSIKSSISESYVPVEIWTLLELEYLQIMGRNLPDPPPGAVLTKLVILLDVGAHTCTKHVIKSIPNVDKIRVQIELMPDDTEPLRFFDDISLLEQLSSLQCVIVNPELAAAPAALVFASCLRKLTLSGFGYPWKDIQVIAELPRLQLLKLRCYAFRGEEWEVGETEFSWLINFSIEDTDLVEWSGGSKNFPVLQCLTIKNCYKLQKIPQMPSVRQIRVVDSNPSAVTCAKLMAPKICSFDVCSSWLESRNLEA